MILEWAPSDAARTELTLVYSDEDQGHDENVPTGVLDLDTIDTFGVTAAIDPLTGLPAMPGAPGLWPNNQYRLAHDLDEHNENESAMAILTFSRRIAPDMELKSITGLIAAEHRRLFDQDVIAAADIARRNNVYTGLSWSTELRLEVSKDRFDWVVGGLYAADDQEQEVRINVGNNADAISPWRRTSCSCLPCRRHSGLPCPWGCARSATTRTTRSKASRFSRISLGA